MNIENVLILNRKSKGIERILFLLIESWNMHEMSVSRNKRNKSKIPLDKFYNYIFNNTLSSYNTCQVITLRRGNYQYYYIVKLFNT